ncbi:MAG: Ig-like domain-containing protein [Lachnospiraceae bacterium]|nr:Ig-like domain-containing protein [Lachnospiraceae bacterium]
MKRTEMSVWKFFFVLLLTAVFMLPSGKAYAEGKIKISISSDYILTWTDYPGAAVYYLSIDGGSWSTDLLPVIGKNKIDLKTVIDERVVPPYDLKNNGRHKILVDGYNADQSKKLAGSDQKIIKYISSVTEYVPDSETLSAKLSGDGILTWRPVVDAALYRIFIDGEYSMPVTESMGTKADLKDVINTLYIDKAVDLKSGGTYKIRLVAYGGMTEEDELDVWDGSFKYTAKKPFLDSYVNVTGVRDVLYTGDPVILVLTVKDGSVKLKEGTDYKVSYKKNTAPGDASVTLTGIGKYDGTITQYFSILKEALPTETDDSSKEEDRSAAADRTPGISRAEAENFLTSVRSGKDPAWTDFGTLQLRVSKVKDRKITLKWKKNSKAAKYVMYGYVAGKKPFKKLAEIKKSKKTYTKKSLKPGKWYKLLLVAYDKNSNVIAASKTVFAATSGGKYTNPAKLKTAAKKNKVKLKEGKSFKLKAKIIRAAKKRKIKNWRKLRYESSDPATAAVSGKGVIKGIKAGSCYVYAYAQNGVFKKIKITVTQ